jgi:uncharacterized repeat protein (TIGR01451 family)
MDHQSVHLRPLQRMHPAIALALLLALLVSACSPSIPLDAGAPPERPNPTTVAALRAEAETHGTVRLLAGLVTPPLDNLDDEQRQATIARARTSLLKRIQDQAIAVNAEYDYFPIIALSADAAGIDALAAAPQISSLEADGIATPALDGSTWGSGIPYVVNSGFTGAGYAVAVIDTGFDTNHHDLRFRIAAEACFQSSSLYTRSAACPPANATSAIGPGASRHCFGYSGCDHGTHVAGIVAAVAPDVRLVTINVFSVERDRWPYSSCRDAGQTSPCLRTTESDVIRGLNHVYSLRNTHRIAAVNLSLGGGAFSGTCDNDSASYTSAIRTLTNAGIVVVAATGNNRHRDKISRPACISDVVSVASVDSFDDRVSDFSNLSRVTTVLAPGAVTAAMPGNEQGMKGGTSQAAPHVAAVAALIKQANPSVTPAQFKNLLTTSGRLVRDTRSGGTLSVRRLDARHLLCLVRACENDGQILANGQSATSRIETETDHDVFFIPREFGRRFTVRVERLNGNLSPYLVIRHPSGRTVAFNSNYPNGTARIDNHLMSDYLTHYVVRVGSYGGTGDYRISVTTAPTNNNPVPNISLVSPGGATVATHPNDFLVTLRGSGFIPESEGRFNNYRRPTFFRSSTEIAILVYSTDLLINAHGGQASVPITVVNPQPGGGTSRAVPFRRSSAFLGESELVAPASGSAIAPELKQTFVISWTHPTDSWRTMQRMDLVLRDPRTDAIALRVGLVEGKDLDTDADITRFHLFPHHDDGEVLASNDDGTLAEPPLSGRPGEERDLVIPGMVTLHLAESDFSGSGQTVTMRPTVSFDPALAGTYNVGFFVDSEEPLDEFGNQQRDDVLGTFTILPPGCPANVREVQISGPEHAFAGELVTVQALADDAAQAATVEYTWSPEPLSGQGTPEATFRWNDAGTYAVNVVAENCGGAAAAVLPVQIATGAAIDLAIELEAPPVAMDGEPFSYTLHVANNGAATAQGLTVEANLPAGATYVDGGTRDGDTVRWTIDELPGYGERVSVSYRVRASSDLVADGYTVQAGAASADGTTSVPTDIVAALTTLSNLEEAQVTAGDVRVSVPMGAVFNETILALQPTASSVATSVEPGFTLKLYQEGASAPELRLATRTTITLSAPVGTGLTLHRYEGGAWSNAGIACAPGEAADTLDCTVDELQAGSYALQVAQTRIYLPLLRR